jgi:hypothetical protein
MFRKYAAVVTTLLLLTGCAGNVPPALTPAATLAFNQTQIEKALDLIRDTAQKGAALNPPVFTVAGARTVTIWHEAAIKVMQTAGQGWQTTVTTSLTQLPLLLTASEATQIAPYIALVQTLISQVS